MTRLRYNNAVGVLSGPPVGDAISFESAPPFATIVAPDYIPLVIDPAEGAPNARFEIVHLTAYTAGATSGTVARGQEGTSPQAHTGSPKWVCAPTVEDMVKTLTPQELIAYAMNLLPLNVQIDPAYAGMFTTVLNSGFAIGAGGQITAALMVWPDGSYGTFEALTLTPPQNPGGRGTTDEYTVTHRPIPDTSATDRTTWVTASPSFAPMSDVAAAALVTRVPEIRSQHVAPFPATGIARNYYVPSGSELSTFYAATVSEWLFPDPTSQALTINPYFQLVTGQCAAYISNPTTDEIIQWASHKWGIPTDQLRGQCHLESRWNMDFLGDLTEVDNVDISGTIYDQYSLYPPYSQIPGGQFVFQSLGIIQVKWSQNSGTGPGSDPLRWKSTAFNLDFACAFIRFYLDDPLGHRTNWGDGSYVSGDYAHAQGGWFSPFPWLNSGQINYVANIADRVAAKPWLVADFSNVADTVEVVHQPLIVRSGGSVQTRPLAVIETYTPPTLPPDPALHLRLTAGDGEVWLFWTAPTDTGGSPITGWLMYETDEGWALLKGEENPGFRFLLPNGAAVRFTIAPITQQGIGPYSASSNSATPTAGLPGQPDPPLVAQDLVDGSLNLAWIPPSPLPTATITHYMITPYDASGVAQTPVNTGSTGTSYNLTGLTQNVPFTFIVAAVNSVGQGPDSLPSAPIEAEELTPPCRPMVAPTFVELYAADGYFILFWNPIDSTFDGGEPVLSYLITEADQGWQVSQGGISSVSFVFGFGGAVPNGTTWRFNVAAVNSLGVGPPSLPSNFATTTAGLPGQPGTASGTPGTGSAALTWTAPSPSPASPITDYIVLPVIDDVPQAPVDTGSTSLSYTVTGLTTGVAYTFRVQAVNSVGAGPPSYDSATYTPT